MKPDIRSVLTGIGRPVALLLLFISCNRAAPLLANTISPPVSVAIPTGMYGPLGARPVSVALPTGMAGELDSRPVSVSLPPSFMMKPVSVAIQPEMLADPDLAGLWHLEGDWADTSGNGNHGVPFNGVAFSSAKGPGNIAASFDGVDDYVQGSTNGFPQGSTARTILVWINTVNASGDQAIFHYGASSSNPPSPGFRLLVAGGKAAVGGGEGNISGTSIVSDGKWHLLSVVYEGSSTNIVRLYVDGAEQNSWVITAPATAGQVFTIGRLNAGGAQFNGLLDEVAIYKRALAGEEIAYRYAAGLSDPSAPLPPTLNALLVYACSSSIVLGGTKPPGTAIWVNRKKLVGLDAQTSWSGTYTPLLPGHNILEVTALDSANRLSLPVIARIFYGDLPQQGNLTFSFLGSGTGVVTGSGIRSCGTVGFSYGMAGSAKFDMGTLVSLSASPTEFSYFAEWSGCDFVSGNGCTLTMNADRGVTTRFEFDTVHKARIGDTTSYHATLQAAYDKISNSGTIKAWATDFAGDLVCTQTKDVTLKGGYCEDYSSNGGYTILRGKLTIQGGVLTVEKLIIK